MKRKGVPRSSRRAGDGVASALLRRSAGSLGVRLAGKGVGLLSVGYLAKVLGAAGFGVYSTAMAWVGIVIIFSTLGFPNLIVRELSAGQVHGAWGRMKGLLRFSGLMVLLVSLACALVVAALVFWLFDDPGQQRMQTAIFIALVLVPLRSLGRLRLSALRGLDHVIMAQIPELLLRPGLFLAACVAATLLLGAFGPLTAIGLQIFATLLAFVVGAAYLHRIMPASVWRATPVYEPRPWIASAWHLMLYAGLYTLLLQTGVVMLGILNGEAEAGAYALAVRASEMIAIFLASVNNPLMPLISSSYAQGDHERLQFAVSRATAYATLASLGPAIILFAAAEPLLSYFGNDYAGAATALQILALTQLLNVLFGPVGTLLNVTGHEKSAATGMFVAAGTNILLLIILAPKFSITGAAIAFMASTIQWNIWLSVLAYKKLQILPGAFSPVFLNKVFRRRNEY